MKQRVLAPDHLAWFHACLEADKQRYLRKKKPLNRKDRRKIKAVARRFSERSSAA